MSLTTLSIKELLLNQNFIFTNISIFIKKWTIKYFNKTMLLYKEAIKMLTIVKKKEKEKKAELMFLFNIGLSPLISKQAFLDFKNGFFISICQYGKLLKRRDIIAIWFSVTTVYRMSTFSAVYTHFESFLVLLIDFFHPDL